MRLIDADALKDELIRESEADTSKSIQTSFAKSVCLLLCKALELQQTVDAVPVIRCYECKYFTEFEKGFSSDWDGSCRYWNTHSTVYSNFCGCGARMDKE